VLYLQRFNMRRTRGQLKDHDAHKLAKDRPRPSLSGCYSQPGRDPGSVLRAVTQELPSKWRFSAPPRLLSACLILTACSSISMGQQSSLVDPSHPESPEEVNNAEVNAVGSQQPEGKRLLGIIPNYRTSPSLQNYKPLTAGEKFKIASQDALDRGSFALAALVGGESQLTNGNRSFGQGAAGFGKYWGASYGDFAIGDYMTEGVFPTLLHQDPRYFRRGIGSRWSRLGYAVGQIFWTHRDSGGTQFNYSEVVGNSAAVAISNAYYANNRTANDAGSKLGLQIGVDMAGNILKEFWPDLARKFGGNHSQDGFPAK
jgi:hypothetical protein